MATLIVIRLPLGYLAVTCISGDNFDATRAVKEETRCVSICVDVWLTLGNNYSCYFTVSVIHKMNPSIAIAAVFIGCCSNLVFLELLIT